MPETTPNPTADAPAAPAKAPANHSALNQRWVQTLNEADQIVRAALKPDYAPAFAQGGIDAAWLGALAADIQAAQSLAGQAVAGTTGRQTVTQTEAALMDKLVGLIREVQQRAKQKHAAKNSTALRDYAVGEKWYNSRAVLDQTATNILARLAADPLPGIDAAKVTALQQALTEYQQVQTDQTGGQSAATTRRQQLAAAVKDIEARRRELQYAADAQWPSTDPANAGLRREFFLPPNRPFR